MDRTKAKIDRCFAKANGQRRNLHKRHKRHARKIETYFRKEIDESHVFLLAEHGATDIAIAAALGIHVQTLRNRCAPILDVARGRLQNKIAHWQVRAASRGDTKMLIWLGKQLLGQRDKIDNSVTGNSVVKILHGVSMDDI